MGADFIFIKPTGDLNLEFLKKNKYQVPIVILEDKEQKEFFDFANFDELPKDISIFLRDEHS